MRIARAEVYGLRESIRGAKFPMAVDVNALNEVLTKGIKELAQCKPGSGHDQWLTGVTVQMDLTFSLKAWPELQRYHWFEFVSSQSTMHRITKFDIEGQVNEYVDPRAVEVLKECVARYNAEPSHENYLRCVYNIPSGFQLTARMSTNYRQLKTVYSQRRFHKLPEWREFCLWVETLPMSFLITGDESDAEV